VSGHILVTYQCDPEYRLVQEYNRQAAMLDLGLRNIDPSNLILPGHPLTERAGKEGEDDTKFPRVGASWEGEHIIGTLGNLEMVLLNEYMVGEIKKKLLGDNKEEREQLKYEQVSAKKITDFLALGGYTEVIKRIVESHIILSGWADGESGRKTMHWLYQALEPLSDFVGIELKRKYGVSLETDGDPTLNWINNQYGATCYGFEIPFKITQVRMVWRHMGQEYRAPRIADVHMVNSASELFNYEC
jgi:hypothetical protein